MYAVKPCLEDFVFFSHSVCKDSSPNLTNTNLINNILSIHMRNERRWIVANVVLFSCISTKLARFCFSSHSRCIDKHICAFQLHYLLHESSHTKVLCVKFCCVLFLKYHYILIKTIPLQRKNPFLKFVSVCFTISQFW